jgi:AtzE family amidohydrolase
MSAVVRMSAVDIAAGVRAGRLRAADVIDAALTRISERNPGLNAFTGVLAEEARSRARAVDAACEAGRDPGVLAGVPFAVKNLFDVEGVVTLAGSVIDADLPPAAADATVVARLRAAGAVLVGCLNMDEYAYGFTTENAHYGPTRNPHDPRRIAGGSSGGSAAAVAADLVPFSLGSDTNGSIRVPAALCGVFGLKPTYGRLSRRGVRPFVHSLDHVGPLARTVADLALVYDLMQGPDAGDPVCASGPAEPVSAGLSAPPTALRVGVLEGWFQSQATPPVRAALGQVAAAFPDARSAALDAAEAARAAAFVLTAAEGGALHLPALRTQPQRFDPATRDRLIAGSLLPARLVLEAQRFRRRFLQSALQLFERFDLLLAPATPFTATLIGERTIRLGDPPGDLEVPIRANLGLYTQPLSFIGLPVLNVPVARPRELPCGVQLIAPPWQEARLFRVASQLERAGVVVSPTPGSPARPA